MTPPDKCPHCQAPTENPRWPGYYTCGSWHNGRDGVTETAIGWCILRQRDALAVRVKELEEAAACLREHLLLKVDRCKNCQGAGQNNDGEGLLDEACPDCEEDRIALALYDNKAKEKP